jgi:putative ABC transport system ATP-binding protein
MHNPHIAIDLQSMPITKLIYQINLAQINTKLGKLSQAGDAVKSISYIAYGQRLPRRPFLYASVGSGNATPFMNSKSSAQPLIEMQDVVKVYATAAGEFRALKGINLQVGEGEFVGIVGKSGAGKSTLLNMLSGVDDLTSGKVFIHANGSTVSIHDLTEDQIALWRGKTLGVVFQSFQLLPMLTLIDNITLAMDLCGVYSARASRARALELLRLVEIEEHADKLPAFISGGQQQRVAIARALANDPPILLADEPTGSLDSVTADHIFEVFEHLVSEQGKTIVMVTHDESLKPRFTRTLGIADGELIHGSNGSGAK